MAISSETRSSTLENLGTGLFSRFPLQISASIRGGYDDNVTTSNIGRQESWFTNAGLSVSYSLGTPRTQLALEWNSGFTYYWDQADSVGVGNDQWEPNVNLRLVLTHKASPRLTFDVSAYATYQSEPDFRLAQGINRRGGNFFFTQDQFKVSYLWTPRFSTATSYTLTALKYEESEIGAFQDRFENTFGNEFRFLVWPTTSMVGEYRFQVVTYDEISRDSTTQYILGGIDHRFNPRFNASFRAGAEFRKADEEEGDGDRSSPYFEGALIYALGQKTTVSWTTRYGIEESDALLNPGRETFRTGLQAHHNFTPRVSGSLAAFYQHDEYFGTTIQNPPGSPTPTTVIGSFTEEALDVALSVRYALTRYFGIEAGYTHTEVWGNLSLREYSRNRYWAGLTVTF
jgi:hypothetical protein